MAKAGIEVYDAQGRLIYDSSNRLFRRLASISYGPANGSATFSRAAEDTSLVALSLGWRAPVFTVDVAASRVSWDYSAVAPEYRFGGKVEIWAS